MVASWKDAVVSMVNDIILYSTMVDDLQIRFGRAYSQIA